jgi:hypothetical protein
MGAAESSAAPHSTTSIPSVGVRHSQSQSQALSQAAPPVQPLSSSSSSPPSSPPVDSLVLDAINALISTRTDLQGRISLVRRSNAALIKELNKLKLSINRLTPSGKLSRDRSQSESITSSHDYSSSISSSLPVSPSALSFCSSAPVNYDEFDFHLLHDPSSASSHLSSICSYYFSILDFEQVFHSHLSHEVEQLKKQLKAFQLRFKHYQSLKQCGCSIKEFDTLINQIHQRAGINGENGNTKKEETEENPNLEDSSSIHSQSLPTSSDLSI